eukprot:CAMPEP_0185729114 /NCGR_PEP_ID=MMETSP1171-20130828/4476_1 /TAXON_ID=374046 /ORGANISM="Helicotheca tamensis, Strain CCMP826" /LENGTH=130 /DNA_ID=CAMNT_0028397891 /DNA_START=169 /DNA_END=558 /DNA_ORIENTATION=+
MTSSESETPNTVPGIDNFDEHDSRQVKIEPVLPQPRTCFSSTLTRNGSASGTDIRRNLTDSILSEAEYGARLRIFQERLEERTHLLRSLKSADSLNDQSKIFGRHLSQRCLRDGDSRSNDGLLSKCNAVW